MSFPCITPSGVVFSWCTDGLVSVSVSDKIRVSDVSWQTVALAGAVSDHVRVACGLTFLPVQSASTMNL